MMMYYKMCINCNLVAPIHDNVCELLGIPRRIYSCVSRTPETLYHLITSMSVDFKFNDQKPTVPDKLGVQERKLYDYLLDNNLLAILENHAKTVQSAGIVDQGLINFVFYSYFKFDIAPSDDIAEKIRVPLELLGEKERIKNGIVKCTYTQEHPIPLSKLAKWKLSQDDIISEAAKLNVVFLKDPFVDDVHT